MNLESILMQSRIRLDDLGTTGVLWTDEDLIAYANAGEREICRRALVLKDATSAITTVSLVSGTSTYVIDPRIILVNRAALDGAGRLKRISVEVLDTILGWEAASGTPSYFSRDYSDGMLLVTPTPNADADLKLTVYRMPLSSMSSAQDIPEIPEELHSYIIDWVCYEAYSKNDADTQNLEKANYFFEKFSRSIGAARPADIFAVIQREFPKYLDTAASQGSTGDRVYAPRDSK